MIYCIKHYLGKTKHQQFVFVGKVDEPIKTALENKDTTDVMRILRKVFGKDYKTLLHLSDPKVRYIYEYINSDDTIGTVLNKIYTFTNIRTDFLWCRTKLYNKSHKLNKIVKYIMGGKKFIPFQEIQEKVNNIFTDTKLEQKEYYTAVDLLSGLSKNTECVIEQSMGCSLHDGSNEVVFSANPYNTQAIFPKNPDLVEKVTMTDLLLSFYTPMDNEINIVTKESGVNDIYLTFKHSIYKTLRESNLPKYSEIQNPSVMNVSYLHLKVNENSIHHTNLLHRCFEEITLDSDIPFARLHKNSSTLFKIHKPSFTDPNMDLKKTHQWFQTASNNFMGQTSPRDEHLVLKFRLPNSIGFFTVVIHNDISYDVKFVFKRDDDVTEGDIPSMFTKVNAKLKEISKLLDNQFIPDMSLNFNTESQYETSTIIKEFIYFMTIEKTMFKISDMKETIASMPRIASLVDTNNIIHFVYKRIDNFSSNDKIKLFTNVIKSKNPNLSASDIKKQIASYFDLEMEDVEKRFDDMTTDIAEYQRYVARKHISVKMKLSDTKGIFVYIDGTHNSRIDNDILKNIHGFIDFITTHKTNTTHAEEIEYFDEEVDLENIEIDEEFQNMLDNLYNNEEDEGEDVNVDMEDAPHRFLLKNLYKADRKLFNTKDKTYSKMCQLASGRQPVPISDDENKYIGANHKDAYNGSVKYGSSKNTQNNYICPRIWCPLTRVPLTQEQYVAAGYKCPTVVKNGKTVNFNEKPIFQDSENYWGKDNKKPRYPGFLSPTKHPEGLCMPCCFSSKQQKWNKCLVNTPVSDKKIKLSRNNEKYIMDYETNPTDVNRFSLLPQPFHSFFGNTKCGHRNNGTGLITTNTSDCVVKKGIPKSDFPLFECFASILDNPSLKSAEDVVQSICDNLTTLEFVSLNCGTLVRQFIPVNTFKHADEKTFHKFKHWAKSNLKYFKRMNIRNVRMKIMSLNDNIDKTGDDDILREFVVYSSYSNFITNIRQYQKPSIFVELVNLKKSWLNAKGINVVFLFSDLYCRLPIYRSFEEIYDTSLDWVFIQEFDNMYEPVYSITSKTPSEFDAIYTFPTNTKSSLKNIIQNISTTTLTQDLYTILKEMDTVDTMLVVLSPDFRAMGFFVNSSLYVPYPMNESWNSMMNFEDEGFIHVQDVYSSDTLASGRKYVKLYKELEEHYNNQGLFNLITDDDHMRLDCGVIIPTKQLVKSSKHIETFIDDKNIFIGLALPDIRLDYMNVLESKTRMYNTFKNEMLALIKEDSTLQKEVYYSRHPYNPFPRHYIVEHLKTTMDVFRKRIIEGDVGKLELTNGPCVKNNDKQSCEKHGKCVFDEDDCRLRIPIGMFDDFMDNFANELTQEDNIVETNVIKHEQPDDILMLSNIDMISSSNDVLMEQLYPKIYE